MARYPHRRLWTAGRLWWATSMGVAALASVAIPYVPLGFAVWLSLSVAAWAWPDPTQAILPNERGYTFALCMRQPQMRRTLIGRNRGLYRLGPRAKDGKKYAEPRQVACASLGAACVAAGFVGADLLLSRLLHQANLVERGVFAPSYRLLWASLASGTFGWIIGHALAELSRAKAAGIEGGEQCPPALMPRGPEWPPRSDPVIRALRGIGARLKALRSRDPEGAETEEFEADFRPVLDGEGSEGRLPRRPPDLPEAASERRPLPREFDMDEPPSEPKKHLIKKLMLRIWRSLPADFLRLARHVAAPWSTRFLIGLTAAGLVVGLSEYPSPWVSASGVVVLISSAVVGWRGWRSFAEIVAQQRKDWFYKRERRKFWHQIWMSMPGANELTVPVYSQEMDFPVGHPEPTHRKVLFGMPSGRDFTDYVNLSHRVATGLDKERVLIEPFQETSGQAHQVGFMVSHELVKLGPGAHLRETQDRYTRDFLVRYAVLSALAALKLGQPLFTEARQVTVRRKPVIYESKWVIADGVTFDQYVAATTKIAEKLGCQWARVYQRPNEGKLTILFGARPSTTQAVTKNDQKLLHEADWFYWMRSVNLMGTNGLPPRLVRAHRNDQGLDELDFALPAGVSRETVLAKLPKLTTASNIPYIREEPLADPSTLRLVCGDKDPLNDTYLFRDYLDTLFCDATRGSPRTSWYLGIGTDGELIPYEWGSDEPHLLIAGNTGAGKSAVVNVMLTQLCHNSDPSDLELWLCDPKNELQAYQHLAHVRYFIDGVCTKATPYEALAALLELAVDEMETRNAIFSLHPQKPQNLARARAIADSDPDSAYLRFPVIIILIEECADYLGRPQSKQNVDAWAMCVEHIEKLARKARFAGIHIVLATQYPTKPNLPTIVKQQSRRIGLRVRDVTASRVVIDEGGLEHINIPGRGFLTGNKGKTEFRALWQDTPSQENPEIGDIRLDTIAALPSVERWPKLPPGVAAEVTVQVNDGSADPEYLSPTAQEVLDSQADATRRAAVLEAMEADDAPRASELGPPPSIMSEDPRDSDADADPSPATSAAPPSTAETHLAPPVEPRIAPLSTAAHDSASAPLIGRRDEPSPVRGGAEAEPVGQPSSSVTAPQDDAEAFMSPNLDDLRAMLPASAPPMPESWSEPPAEPAATDRPAVPQPPLAQGEPNANGDTDLVPAPPVLQDMAAVDADTAPATIPVGADDEMSMQEQALLLKAARRRSS